LSSKNKMNDYQKEQWDALSLIMIQIGSLDGSRRHFLETRIAAYLAFRQRADQFLRSHFADHCTRSCFENRLSACCSKDGIITFWADAVVNALVSSDSRMEDLFQALARPSYAHKCTYLGPDGCRWQVRPLMCAMFLCDAVQGRVFGADPSAEARWDSMVKEAKSFRWPDRPVLFDWLETYFMELGCRSPLMYINTSPGLLRVKKAALGKQIHDDRIK
jgi:hypothetical protein